MSKHMQSSLDVFGMNFLALLIKLPLLFQPSGFLHKRTTALCRFLLKTLTTR